MPVRMPLINKMMLLARALGDEEFHRGNPHYEPNPIEAMMLQDPIGFVIIMRTIMFEEVSEAFEQRLIGQVCRLSFQVIAEVEAEYGDEEDLDDDEAVDERESVTQPIENITLEFLRKMKTSKMQLERLLREAVSASAGAKEEQLFCGYIIDLMTKLGFEIPTNLKPLEAKVE